MANPTSNDVSANDWTTDRRGADAGRLKRGVQTYAHEDGILVLVAHDEPTEIRRGFEATGRGVIADLPHGMDFCFYAHGQKIGIQRKSWVTGDIYTSLPSLGEQLASLAAQCGLAFLLLEGTPKAGNNVLFFNNKPTNWLVEQVQHMLLEIQFTTGIYTLWSPAIHNTPYIICQFADWMSKSSHSGILHRPKPQGDWGVVTDDMQKIHILQGFPGVGQERAENIIKHFGRVPLKWDCSEKELTEVPKLGKKTIQGMVKALQ